MELTEKAEPQVLTPELIGAIKVYHFEPGDVVIIRCPGMIEVDTAERIKRMWNTHVPGVRCLVFSEGMELDVIRGLPA